MFGFYNVLHIYASQFFGFLKMRYFSRFISTFEFLPL
jgi:hypothetical protein